MTGPGPGARPVRAAVVAADPRDARVLGELLRETDGVTLQDDPRDADLIVIDLGDGGGDPVPAIAALAAAQGDDRPPAIVVAVEGGRPAPAALVDAADDVLAKPLRLADERPRLRRAVRRARATIALRERVAAAERSVDRARARLEAARTEALEHLAIVAGMRGGDSREHQRAVARLSVATARELGLPEGYRAMLRLAAPLHDIGKVGVPDELLLKPSALTAREMLQVQQHCALGARILAASEAPHMRLAQEIALSHHERWDGRGYPQGLRGDQIPLGARIVAVADAYDTMRRPRPGRPVLEPGLARAVIAADRGSRFDPAVVGAFEAALENLAQQPITEEQG